MSTDINSLPNENPNSNNIKLKVSENNAPPPVTKNNNAPHHNPLTELSKESIQQIVSGIQEASKSNLTELPSRNIPNDINRIDPNTQVNHIPQPPQNVDYINNQDTFQNINQQNQIKNQETDKLDNIYNELQTPVVIMIIFFLFQLPSFNKLFIKYAPSLYLKDGHHNFTGYLVKTVLFGLSYFAFTKLVKYVTEI